jgi:hypothetical protein
VLRDELDLMTARAMAAESLLAEAETQMRDLASERRQAALEAADLERELFTCEVLALKMLRSREISRQTTVADLFSDAQQGRIPRREWPSWILSQLIPDTEAQTAGGPCSVM